MKKIFALVVFLALGGAVFLWWFTRLATDAPPAAKVAEAPTALKPALVQSTPKLAQVEAPKVAPVMPQASSTAAGANPANSDPQAELGDAIDDITTMMQAGNTIALFEKYTPPDKMARITPEQKAAMKQRLQKQLADPQTLQMQQGVAQALRSFKNQTPEMNAAGDEATYQLTPTADMLPPGAPLPPPAPITFIKIDGHWYIKNGL